MDFFLNEALPSCRLVKLLKAPAVWFVFKAILIFLGCSYKVLVSGFDPCRNNLKKFGKRCSSLLVIFGSFASWITAAPYDVF